MIMLPSHQQTLSAPVSFQGPALHSGKKVSLCLKPAKQNTGLVCVRKDRANLSWPLNMSHVKDTYLATKVGPSKEDSISTVEHLLSAVAALCIDNLVVEIEGPECPILDGSSFLFYKALKKAGLSRQQALRPYALCKAPFKVEEGDKSISCEPVQQRDFLIDYEIDFPHSAIGKQHMSFSLYGGNYERDISKAKTFGFEKDGEALQKQGLALGANLENTLVYSESELLNGHKSSYADECIRHKILDAIGDMYLLGLPLLGHLKMVKAGHHMSYQFLKKFLHSGAFEKVYIKEGAK